jgi:hypothetical protein
MAIARPNSKTRRLVGMSSDDPSFESAVVHLDLVPYDRPLLSWGRVLEPGGGDARAADAQRRTMASSST